MKRIACGVILACASGQALAHSPIAGLGDFYNGLLHPLLVTEHLIGVAALALCLGQHSITVIRQGLFAFLAGMLLALFLPVMGQAVTGSVFLVLIGFCCGALALGRPLPDRLGVLLAALVGCFIGLDSFGDAGPGWLLPAGMFLGVGLLFLYLTRLGTTLQRPWQHIVRRILGAWGSASILLVLVLQTTIVSG
ncbi:hypothetical protein PS874_01511 [Pseudomonas fluorescens]|nr:hypothetical protein PS874_01511 [Pseudomonas fluorescens]